MLSLSNELISKQRLTAFPYLLSAVLIYSFLCFLTFSAIEEDAFIYFKFAANLADGYGYVFNRDGERIESGSSPFWLFILSVLYALPLHIISITKIVGYLSGILCLLLMWGICHNLSIKRIYALTSLLLTACTANFVLCSHWGLESPLYVASILLLVWLCTHRNWSNYWSIGAIAVLLSRPEGFFILFALLPFIFLAQKGGKNFFYSTLFIGLCFCVFTLLRLYYFKDYLPHPFYLKMGFNFNDKLTPTLQFLNRPYFYLLAVPVMAAFLQRRFWSTQIITIVSITLLLSYWSVIAGDQKPYLRHLLPALVLFYLLVAKGLSILPLANRRYSPSISLLLIFTCILINNNYISSNDLHARTNPLPLKTAFNAFIEAPALYTNGFRDKFKEPMTRTYIDRVDFEKTHHKKRYQSLVGEFINANYPKGITLIYDQMGKTPFYSGLDKNYIDSRGLTYKTTGYYHFLHRAEHSILLSNYKKVFTHTKSRLSPNESLLTQKKSVLDHLFSIDPDVIMINKNLAKKLPDSVPALLQQDPRLESLYQKAYLLAGLVEVYEKPGFKKNKPITPNGLHVVELGSSLAQRAH